MNELLTKLDNIAEITITINKIYNKLINLEQNTSNCKDYEQRKDILLSELTFEIIKENNYYKYFNTYEKCIEAINYITSNSIKYGINKDLENCVNRIICKLKDTAFTYGFNNPNFIKEFKENNYYKFLIKKGLDDGQIFPFLIEYIPRLNDNINVEFISITNNFLSVYENDENKNRVIKIKYERSLINSGFAERNLIATSFNTSYSSDIRKSNYKIDENIINDFTSYVLYQNTFNIIGKIIVNNYELKDIIQFASNTGYINKKDLNRLKMQISNLKSLNTDLKTMLVEYLDTEINKENEKGRIL